MIPKRDECLKILREHDVPEHIISHSLTVERVALFIAEEVNAALDKEDSRLDNDLISAGALLHDIAKVKAMETGEHHGMLGGKMVREIGFPEVADLVEQHIRLRSYDKNGRISEAEVINYADKRVTHDDVVTLSHRFSDIRRRYGKNSDEIFDRIDKTMELTLIIERKIFDVIPIDPDDLVKMLELTD
ncbi:MAG: HDIG domain-containing protein [Deltaproteobacteria bacterium]|uniref:HDIG domain-containing protein n=1 Tax=Candidatus Zymogenus saltonus TaxID=2844893 RepID=A0A9D8PMY3_9DELT|nr:HDIG domain-containing protein [Candidatus Zymogenus saltonus]